MDATFSWGRDQVPGKLSGLAQMAGTLGGEQFASRWPSGRSRTRKVISTINADIALKYGAISQHQAVIDLAPFFLNRGLKGALAKRWLPSIFISKSPFLRQTRQDLPNRMSTVS